MGAGWLARLIPERSLAVKAGEPSGLEPWSRQTAQRWFGVSLRALGVGYPRWVAPRRAATVSYRYLRAERRLPGALSVPGGWRGSRLARHLPATRGAGDPPMPAAAVPNQAWRKPPPTEAGWQRLRTCAAEGRLWWDGAVGRRFWLRHWGRSRSEGG
jgi:hypothetical protein